MTIVLQATRIAISTHQQEKLEALRNAVLNSALPGAPEDDVQMTFMKWIDELTPTHLRVLKFFENPHVWIKNNNVKINKNITNKTVAYVLIQAFPDLQKGLGIKWAVSNLDDKDLLTDFKFDHPMSDDILLQTRLSKIGYRFLKFIELPEALKTD